MLILTRRVGEELMVGDDITVTVLGVNGGQVRIGIGAPKNVSVHRMEIYERIQNEKLDKATSVAKDFKGVPKIAGKPPVVKVKQKRVINGNR